MTRGRGSAGQIVGFGSVIALAWLLAQLQNADAAVYRVGGPSGWTFNVESWPQGKRFSAGDTLIFSYDPMHHNVVVVNQAGYRSCSPGRSKVYQSGNDKVQLVKGLQYFICSFPGHCESGMKIAVNAL